MVLGLAAGTGDARALDTEATASLTLSIDASDDVAEVELIVPILAPLAGELCADAALITSDLPPAYEHAELVFRPPRAYAFN